jgi:hypothetical protein
LVALSLLLAGCQSPPEKSADNTPSPAVVASPAPVAPVMAPAAPAPSAASVPMLKLPIRIKAGSDGFTDSEGNVWLADQGFADGETDDRPGIAITNAPDARLYQSERYSMTRFTESLPNGKYIVKLHFCETYDGITGPGDRVFSFNVAGHEFKNFDIWVKAGGIQRAYVETVPVEVTDGQLVITFTPNVENPQINAIEILSAYHDLPGSNNP